MFTLCICSVLDNAIKFSPNNGKITINPYVNDGFTTIDIIDNGPGFSKKALENLFNLFSVGDKHVNENEGLELALAKLIVDAHNGMIQVENPDIGAKVSISIPLNPTIEDS